MILIVFDNNLMPWCTSDFMRSSVDLLFVLNRVRKQLYVMMMLANLSYGYIIKVVRTKIRGFRRIDTEQENNLSNKNDILPLKKIVYSVNT